MHIIYNCYSSILSPIMHVSCWHQIKKITKKWEGASNSPELSKCERWHPVSPNLQHYIVPWTLLCTRSSVPVSFLHWHAPAKPGESLQSRPPPPSDVTTEPWPIRFGPSRWQGRHLGPEPIRFGVTLDRWPSSSWQVWTGTKEFGEV